MIKIPEYYRPKTRSRKGIVEFFRGHDDYYRHQATCSPVAWNVKSYGEDLSFENLLAIYREAEGDPDYTHFEEWLGPVRALYEENEENLFDWGIEGARRTLTETDCYNHLWDGTRVDVEYAIEGRSGGWVVLKRFEGHDLTRVDKDTFLGELLDRHDWSYAHVLNLYRLVLMLDHDLRREAVESEIEYQASDAFFRGVCDDVPQVEMTQPSLPLSPEENR